MSIYAKNNNQDPWNSVDVKVVCEPVPGNIIVDEWSGKVVLPPARAPGDWRTLWLWYDVTTRERGVVVNYVDQGAPPLLAGRVGKLIGAWGTRPRETASMLQVQTDRVVQFQYDADFDLDYGKDVKGDGLWKYRGNYGGWPRWRSRIIYVRAEAGRKLETGSGICQINFGSEIVEGQAGQPTNCYITQVKGYSSAGNRDVAQDWLRVIVDPQVGQLGVKINDRSLGCYLNSGFELEI